MNRNRSTEQGASLVIVMGFVVFSGLIVTGLLNQVQNNSTTLIARKLNDRAAAANAGLEYYIRLARANGTICPSINVTSAPFVIPVADRVNGRDVTITCTVLAGGATGAGGWAAFVTNGGALTVSNGSKPKKIQGATYNGGTTSVSGGTSLRVENGPYIQLLGGTCPPAGVLLPTPLVYGATCGSTLDYAAAAPPPRPLPASIASLPMNPAVVLPTTSSECRIFSPGIYSNTDGDASGAVKLNSLSSNNYFRPGVYVIKLSSSAGDPVWHIRRWVTAGKPNSGTTVPELRQTTTSPCPTNSPVNTAADNDGAVFLLASDTRIQVEKSGNKNGHFEVFSYLDGDVITPSVSIRQLLLADSVAAPWVVGSYVSTVSLADPPILSDDNGTGPELSVHGNVWVPRAAVSLIAVNETRAKLRGGVVAGSLSLQASNSVGTGALDISTQQGVGKRRMVIVADVQQIGNEKPLRARAVVDVLNDSAHTADIVSWVVEND